MVGELLMENNSFINLLESTQIDRNEDTRDPIIFQHSPYYEDAGFSEITEKKTLIICL